MKYLVVNGDDLGYSVPRNEGILRCFTEGIVTSTSILINGEAVLHAVDLVHEYQIPTGLHLNLSEGLPLTEATSLLGEDGCLLGKLGIRELNKLGNIDFKQVDEEMQAQIDKFELLMGVKPFHVDGHQHVHLLPGISKVFSEVLARNGIFVTRLPIEDISETDLPNKDFLQTVINDSHSARQVFDRFGIKYAEKFIGLDSFETSVDSIIEKLADMLNGGNHGDTFCEFMVHPGYRTEQEGGCGCGPDDFSQSHYRENELNLLCDIKLKKFIEKSKLKLVSYESLFLTEAFSIRK
ncbi:carbohydrate deacetylase-like [Mytilus galloprovincialis]|uniref:carbohydrate deacetylase-like n=1 Tax=Mytilus galloprovincialis TaxID=29158 RepID=UPI003F7C959D